jgi:hypothetical protein
VNYFSNFRSLMFQKLQLLLKLNTDSQRVLTMPAPSNPADSFVKSNRNLSLLSLQNEVRKTTNNNGHSILGSNLPRPALSPLRVFPSRLHRTSKMFLAPQRKSRVGVGYINPDISSFVVTAAFSVELTASMNINTSFTVDESCKSNPIHFGRHVAELRKDSITVRER